MRSYLLLSDWIPAEPTAPGVALRRLRDDLYIVESDDPAERLVKRLRSLGWFPPQGVLLGLAHPFDTVGLDSDSRERFASAALASVLPSFQALELKHGDAIRAERSPRKTSK